MPRENEEQLRKELKTLESEQTALQSELKALTVGGEPIEGFEEEWHEKHQTLQALKDRRKAFQDQLAALESQLPEPEGPPEASAEAPGEEILAEKPVPLDDALRLSSMLAEAKSLAEKGDFSGALEILEQARGLVLPGSPLHAQIGETWREVARERGSRRQALVDTARQALDRKPFNEEEAIWAIEDLERFEPGSPDVARLREELAERTRQAAEERQYQELRARLEAIWQEVEEAEAKRAGGMALVDKYKQAHELAMAVAANYPGSLSLDGLVKEALRRYTQARDRHQWPTTLQETDAYRDAIRHLEQTKVEQGGGARVTIAPDPTELERQVTTSVDEALEIMRHAARRWAAQKAQDYQDEANMLMNAHSPAAAEKKLEDGLALFQLDEEVKARSRDQLERTIHPAVQRRKEAEAKVRQAERVGPAEAWEQIVRARDLDEHTPGLEDAWRQARIKLEDHIKKELLAQARTRLDEANWKEARKLVDRALELIQRDASFISMNEEARQLQAECLEWERVAREVAENVTRLREEAKTDPQSAATSLDGLLKHWGEERSKHFAELTALRAELEARVNLERLVARLESAIRSEDEKVVEQAIQECQRAIEANLLQRSRLQAISDRLRFHKRYLEGLRLLDQNLVPQGLQVLKEVSESQKADERDREEARKRWERIISDQTTEAEVTAALEKARRAMAQGRPDEAYQTLRPWSTRENRHSDEVALLLEEAARTWEQRIVQELNQALKGDKLDIARVRQLVEKDLKTLGSPLAPEWERRAVSRCEAQQAKEFEQGGSWEKAVAHWEEAKNRNPDEAQYEIRWRRAQKQAGRTRVESPDLSAVEAEQILLDLEKKQPADPEVKKWLAEHYLGQALEQVRKAEEIGWAGQLFDKALKKAQEGARLLGPTIPRRWAQELEELIQWIEEEEEISRQQWEVERLLGHERSVDDYARARKLGEALATRRGRQDLNRWWWTLRQRTLDGAEKRLAEQKTRGADVWQKLLTLGQILALEPDHGQAKDEVSQLYGEVLKLEEALDGRSGLTKNKTGGGYPGKDEDALVQQLEEALLMERRLNLTYQMLNHFGGYVQEGARLREQVGTKDLRTCAGLVSTLQRFKLRVGEVEGAIAQAKSTDDWRVVTDALSEVREQLGYPQHRTVIYLEKRIDQVKQKRQRLVGCRQQVERAAEREDFVEALRWAARMQGRSLESLLPDDASLAHLPGRATDEEEADPQDEYGEQRRVSVKDPYTNEPIRGLRALVPLLREKQQQVMALEKWLGQVVAGDLIRAKYGQREETAGEWAERVVNEGQVRVASWARVTGEADKAVARGDFRLAQELCQQVQQGDGDTHSFRGMYALAPVAAYLEKPPAEAQPVKSLRGEKLLQQGVSLLQKVRQDLEAARVFCGSLAEEEAEWEDRFTGFNNLFRALEEFSGWRGWLQRGKRDDLRQQVYAALAACQEVCPEHPNLAGYDGHPLLR